jgi:hypothetical protein
MGMIEWYQSRVNRRNANLVRRVLSLILFLVFAKIFSSISHLCFLIYNSDFNDYLLLLSFSFLDDS